MKFPEKSLHQGCDANGTSIHYCDKGKPYFKRERYSDDIVAMRHTGWSIDTECSETLRGIVVRLPHGRYLAGYFNSAMDEHVYYSTIHHDEDEAARIADEHARVIAEQELEYSERYLAMSQIEVQIEDKTWDLRQEVELRNFKSHCVSKEIRRQVIRGLIAHIRLMRKNLATSFKGM